MTQEDDFVGHFTDSPGYAGGKTLHLNTALIISTTLVVSTRLYVRAFMAKALGWDDILAFLAFGTIVALSAMDIRRECTLDPLIASLMRISVVQYGSGAHAKYVPNEDLAIWFESIVTQVLIYFIGTGLMRLSIVAFLPRLSQDSLHCVPPESENTMMVAHQAIGIILDLALMGLPIWVIHTKMLFSKRAFQVILVFSVGVFVIVTGCIRLVMMKTLLFLADPTYNMTTVGVWTDLEGHIGLWVASFPALQPLVRAVSCKLGFGSKVQSYGRDGNSNTANVRVVSSGAPWSVASRNKRDCMRKASDVDDTDSHSESRIITGNSRNMEMSPIDSRVSGIHKQVEFDVRVDEAKHHDGRPTYSSGQGSKSWVAV
ncbi:hypothetical protein Cob_v010132 [Colletotrichum orbiculare MAFF 240422]|uniref:Rhodopsin domain-containing protein n=1 Tax=Colletotrichum orbiculare (strain 104-T / ATCC 96160 / CBS 514.97 / LARS 414 / MAFF 240422) TaxID=1213857 RepID=A0A484FH48_COLOR|nr:hypothetical protein Cob_v010132 [Colletotrichum orbiculare MAFF 240422]